ncbi:MAG: hypothetical protein AABX86_03115 [Nanoarchaeota archaeon]
MNTAKYTAITSTLTLAGLAGILVATHCNKAYVPQETVRREEKTDKNGKEYLVENPDSMPKDSDELIEEPEKKPKEAASSQKKNLEERAKAAPERCALIVGGKVREHFYGEKEGDRAWVVYHDGETTVRPHFYFGRSKDPCDTGVYAFWNDIEVQSQDDLVGLINEVEQYAQSRGGK